MTRNGQSGLGTMIWGSEDRGRLGSTCLIRGGELTALGDGGRCETGPIHHTTWFLRIGQKPEIIKQNNSGSNIIGIEAEPAHLCATRGLTGKSPRALGNWQPFMIWSGLFSPSPPQFPLLAMPLTYLQSLHTSSGASCLAQILALSL